MKAPLIFAVISALVGATAHAADSYESYDAFYAAQPGVLFGAPIEFDRHAATTDVGDEGSRSERQASINGQVIHIDVASSYLSVNGTTYRFARAMSFEGEHASEIYPIGADVYVAARSAAHPAAICLEGDSNGSREAARHKQVYLLVDPQKAGSRTRFLQLPSLLSSCRAIAIADDGKLVFPKNSYVYDAAQAASTGLSMAYYTFEKNRFVAVAKHIRLRFITPDVPFRFSLQSDS